ncbi:RNA-directed DNA polymerase from mobile element jockey [Trichonephila clavipes]|nr:RNA-directed DNA polymerase from mobile element jockey [Trichonephila clavipes]
MFGTRVPYDESRNRRPNQCWRSQGFFHTSEVCHLPMKCLKCAGPHQTKDCTLQFEDPLQCANCGEEHAANWRQCPRFPKSKKAPTIKTKNANGLRLKICEVRNFVSEQNPDLLLVQETKLLPGLETLIANYRLHKDDRNNFPFTRTDRGTTVYCKNNYDHNRSSITDSAQEGGRRSPLEKAEVIADSLQKQFEPNTEAENERFTAHTQRKIKRFLDAPTCLDLEKTTPGEVQEYIKKLKINKSPGLDLITNRILKNLPLKFVLYMLLNLLMENCHFPKNWKTAVVVPILKSNSDGTRSQNYCPISLLSSLSEAYDFVLLNRLNQHCIARNIIIPEQHGFVTQRSTVTQLLRVTKLIHHGFQNNQATGRLFVDIAKAFDKILHVGLLSKMMQLGFSDQLIKIIHSYLNSLEFRVRVENSLHPA